MSSLYDPPGHESKHLKNHYEVVDRDSPDRLWKGVVLAMCSHTLQPLVIILVNNLGVGFRLDWGEMFVSQSVYMLPAMLFAYRLWGVRALRGVVYVFIGTGLAVLGLSFGVIMLRELFNVHI